MLCDYWCQLSITGPLLILCISSNKNYLRFYFYLWSSFPIISISSFFICILRMWTSVICHKSMTISRSVSKKWISEIMNKLLMKFEIASLILKIFFLNKEPYFIETWQLHAEIYFIYNMYIYFITSFFARLRIYGVAILPNIINFWIFVFSLSFSCFVILISDRHFMIIK